MITFEQPAPNVVIVRGIDLSLAPPQVWRRALEAMATNMQRKISARYENEVTAQFAKFRRNTPKWNAHKARKGYSPKRGQMLRRIIGKLKRWALWGITAISPAGTAVITFDELYLYTLEPHARWYARHKVPGGRILTVNKLDIERSSGFVRGLDMRLRAEEIAKLERKKITIGTGLQGLPAKQRDRRILTLARTAWAAYAQTAAKLRLLGRI